MRIVHVFAPLLLAGCVTSADISGNIEERYVGKPIDVAIERLGYPAEEKVVVGRRLVVWNKSSTVASPKTYTASNGATVSTIETSSLGCSLTLEVAQDGTVKDYDWEGQMGACERFAR